MTARTALRYESSMVAVSSPAWTWPQRSRRRMACAATIDNSHAASAPWDAWTWHRARPSVPDRDSLFRGHARIANHAACPMGRACSSRPSVVELREEPSCRRWSHAAARRRPAASPPAEDHAEFASTPIRPVAPSSMAVPHKVQEHPVFHSAYRIVTSQPLGRAVQMLAL